MNMVPDKINNFNVYDEGNVLVGVSGEITLPNLESMSETISGAGIAGEIDMPTPGHFGAISIEIPFRTLYDQSFSLLSPRGRIITLRASQSSWSSTEGKLVNKGLKITLKTIPKGLDLGTIGVGKPTGSTNSLEVLYIKVELDGKTLLELDKLNYIFVVNGEDILKDVRNQI